MNWYASAVTLLVVVRSSGASGGTMNSLGNWNAVLTALMLVTFPTSIENWSVLNGSGLRAFVTKPGISPRTSRSRMIETRVSACEIDRRVFMFRTRSASICRECSCRCCCAVAGSRDWYRISCFASDSSAVAKVTSFCLEGRKTAFLGWHFWPVSLVRVAIVKIKHETKYQSGNKRQRRTFLAPPAYATLRRQLPP
eukprot:CAMPEP_0178983190 /NCGR_PEP_ID=MMETSP0795-20121207/913_1 /TAXON_ID=88552 /ORGANISM="Amoebophrya sp., Strain Ameob2" /LENGTH=195 /DNA_ID=CAMNT_0020673917 /DNA_START=324 /DNA_END=911 /DNA_ORIENTATION=+